MTHAGRLTLSITRSSEGNRGEGGREGGRGRQEGRVGERGGRRCEVAKESLESCEPCHRDEEHIFSLAILGSDGRATRWEGGRKGAEEIERPRALYM